MLAIPKVVRYRLAFIRSGEEAPAILYDNHHPKGHHRHIGEHEEPYDFVYRETASGRFPR